MMNPIATACGLALGLCLSASAQASNSLAAGLPDASYSQSWYWPGTDQNAQSAFNGGGWNAGEWGKQWIQVDLLHNQPVNEVSFLTVQSPDGITGYSVFLADTPIGADWARFTPLAAVSGPTTHLTPFDLTFAMTSGRFLEIVADGGPSWTAVADVRVLPAPVPEPAGMLLMLAGLGVVVAKRARRA
jgi:hypothetical protein